MVSLQVRLASAYEQYRAGRYDSAATHLQGLKHPKAAHLLGMIARQQGRYVEAREHLEWACAQAPEDAEIVEALGRVYAQSGQADAAERCFRQALKLSPKLAGAEAQLGRLLLDEQRYREAHDHYAQVLLNKPSDIVARYGRASAMLEQGQAEAAEAEFAQLPQDRPEIAFMQGRAALETGDFALARAALERSFAKAPQPNTLRTLAQVQWLTGDVSDFEALVTKAAQTPGLGTLAVEIARSSSRLDWAWDVGLSVVAEKEDPLAFRSVMAALAVERRDAASAVALSADVVQAHPDYSPAVAALVSAQLMQGKTATADEHIERMRAAQPQQQHWIGYALLAARQRGEDVSSWTIDLARTYELPVPEGFGSLAEFNAEFVRVLEALHQSRQHPLDQSLRGGTQTQRNLVGLDNPVIKAYLRALREPVEEHLKFLSSIPDNPCVVRNTGQFSVQECWSVVLAGEGFHASHVHPNGWLSSAYYVAVPDENPQVARAGWLKFGEPPFALESTQPALQWVQPRPGLLALFPSYLWHSTEPTVGSGKRITAPFDIVPA